MKRLLIAAALMALAIVAADTAFIAAVEGGRERGL